MSKIISNKYWIENETKLNVFYLESVERPADAAVVTSLFITLYSKLIWINLESIESCLSLNMVISSVCLMPVRVHHTILMFNDQHLFTQEIESKSIDKLSNLLIFNFVEFFVVVVCYTIYNRINFQHVSRYK